MNNNILRMPSTSIFCKTCHIFSIGIGLIFVGIFLLAEKISYKPLTYGDVAIFIFIFISIYTPMALLYNKLYTIYSTIIFICGLLLIQLFYIHCGHYFDKNKLLYNSFEKIKIGMSVTDVDKYFSEYFAGSKKVLSKSDFTADNSSELLAQYKIPNNHGNGDIVRVWFLNNMVIKKEFIYD